MKLIIVQPGRYNDAHGHARSYTAGEGLETSLEYGRSLVDSGYARPAEAAVIAPAGIAPAVAPEKNRRKKAAA
jgi:hypothetical protein